MIMKRKYFAAIFASVSLLALAASVTAQQNAAQPRGKSADMRPAMPEVPEYIVNPVSSGFVVGQPGGPYNPYGNTFGQTFSIASEIPERNQLMQSESALAHQVEELKRRLDGAATDADRSKVRTQLAELLGKQFDIRQKRHGLEIEALESQVKKLKDLVRKRNESREEIISRRADQILREAEGLGW
jgi:hypothetical protein